MNRIILEQNAEAFDRKAFYSEDPMWKAYSTERMAALKGGGQIDWERFAFEVGAGAPCPTSAAHGSVPTSCPPMTPCAVKPPRCDCEVIGGNTLGGNQIGVANLAGRFGTITLDSGDAGSFVPYFMFSTAFQVGGGTPDDTVTGPDLPILLQDSRSGREPNLRRASTTDPAFGILMQVYGDEKELECVDWGRFASTNNQQLVCTGYNPNDNAAHWFVDMWGVALA